MNLTSTFYGLYAALPVAAQNALVSLYGYILRARRYGRGHARYLAWLMETRKLDLEGQRELQLRELQDLLAYAARCVPYYRDLFQRIGFDPRDVTSLEHLQQLPVTEKEDVKAAPERFRSTCVPRWRIYEGQTSGTSGKPLVTYKTRETYQKIWAFQDRQRLLWGMDGRRPRVSLVQRLIVPRSQDRPPFWRYDRSGDNWYFSIYHMKEANLASYLEKLEEIDPEEVRGIPSALYVLARYANKVGWHGIRPKGIICATETVYDFQREEMERAFGCKVADQYGSSESVIAVFQCPHGTYHVHPEFGILETLDGTTPVRGRIGDVVGTGFVNRAQVLIRYRIGDSAVLATEPPACECGWTTEALLQVVGRIDDVLYTPEGDPIGRLDYVLRGAPGVREGQIVQDAPDHLTVRFVAEGEPNPEAERVVGKKLASIFGPRMRIDYAWVPEIPRERSGKFRYQLNLCEASSPGKAPGELIHEDRS